MDAVTILPELFSCENIPLCSGGGGKQPWAPQTAQQSSLPSCKLYIQLNGAVI